MPAEKTVDAYVKGLPGWRGEVVTVVRQLIKEAAPEAKESIKWAQPVYEVNDPCAYIKAFSYSVNFGFWRGAELSDPKGLLQGGGDRMKHLKLTSVADIKKKELQDLVKAAVALNKKLGDPTKRKD